MSIDRSSITQAPSLRPDIEFEIIKLTVLRENYVKRINEYLKSLPPEKEMDITLVGLVDVLRETTMQIVETISTWEKTQVDNQNVKPFLWNGVEYLHKMITDLDQFDENEQLKLWLGFSLRSNPFFVPDEVLKKEFTMTPQSYVVFGIPPSKRTFSLFGPLKHSRKGVDNRAKAEYIKSPYNTRIVNDPRLLPSSTALKAKALLKQKVLDEKMRKYELRKEDSGNVFETYLSFETVSNIRNLWFALVNRYPSDLQSYSDGDSFNNVSFNDTGFKGTAGISINNADGMLETKHVDVVDTQFHTTFDSSIRGTVKDLDENKTMRIKYLGSEGERSKVLFNTVPFGGTDVPTQPHLWSTHEVKLQISVHRKGGELFTLTAAGTQGRMKAPHRKSRLERMHADLEHVDIQVHTLGLTLEDDLLLNDPFRPRCFEPRLLKETLRSFLFLQKTLRVNLHYFRLVMHSDFNKDLNYRKVLKDRQPGLALEADEYLSVELENKMASRIQRAYRVRRLNKSLRSEASTLNRAATFVQLTWRVYVERKKSMDMQRRTRLALQLQKLYRSLYSKAILKDLRFKHKLSSSCLNIQRVYRGYVSRKKTKMKVKFINEIKAAKFSVSTSQISMNDVEQLADYIFAFLRTSAVELPTSLMAVLRGLIYMFIGDKVESIHDERNGYFKPFYITAQGSSYQMTAKLLRRKGRLLRRLRSLSQSVEPPNALPLNFCSNCVIHLTALVDTVSARDFDSFPVGARRAAVQFYHYCVHMKAAYDLQAYFPEMFSKSLPGWFKSLMKIRRLFDEARLKYVVSQECVQQVKRHLDYYVQRNKCWKPVGDALERALEFEKQCLRAFTVARKNYELTLNKLNVDDDLKLSSLADLEKARQFGLKVAEQDLADYKRVNLVADEDKLRSLEVVVEEKHHQLLEAQYDFVISTALITMGRQLRSLESMIDLSKSEKRAERLGVILGDLFVLERNFYEFLDAIGGEQFLVDLDGVDKRCYLFMKDRALKLMNERKIIMQKLQIGVNKAIFKVTNHAYQGIKTPNWDSVTPALEEAEMLEDKECARKDSASLVRMKDNSSYQIPHGECSALLLLLDVRISVASRDYMIRRLESLNFAFCSADPCDVNATGIIQDLLDTKKNIIFCVDRGTTRIGRNAFISRFENLVASLLPRPQVVVVEALENYAMHSWHSVYSFDFFSANEREVIEGSLNSLFGIGICRRYAYLLALCILFERKATVPEATPSLEYWVYCNKYARKQIKDVNSSNDVYDEILFDLINDASLPESTFASYIPKWFQDSMCASFTEFLNGLWLTIGNYNDEAYFSLYPPTTVGDLVLVCTIVCIFDEWDASVLSWTDADILAGCNRFLTLCSDLRAFCEFFSLLRSPVCDFVKIAKLARAREAAGVWSFYSKATSLTSDPVRFMFSNWALEAMNFIERYVLIYSFALLYRTCNDGGLPRNDDPFYSLTTILYSQSISWSQDSSFLCSERVIGQILNAAFKDNMIYDNESSPLLINFQSNEGVKELVSNNENRWALQLEMHKRVRVYHRGAFAYVAVDFGREEIEFFRKRWKEVFGEELLSNEGDLLQFINSGTTYFTFFTMISLTAVVEMMKVTNQEILLESYPDLKLGHGENDEKWYTLLSKWIRLDVLPERFDLCIFRCRSLLFVKCGAMYGYDCRVEIYEDKSGELLAFIRGIENSRMLRYRFNKDILKYLFQICDQYEEKEKMEANDILAIASICSDRMIVSPSYRWKEFLSFNSFAPASYDMYASRLKPRVALRVKRGPGRFVGMRSVRVCNTTLIISIYEVLGEGDAHALRIVMYEPIRSQTAEYRLSSMERFSLFSDDVSLLDQIISRMRLVYCDCAVPSRVVIKMSEDYRPDFSKAAYSQPVHDNSPLYSMCTLVLSDVVKPEKDVNVSADDISEDSDLDEVSFAKSHHSLNPASFAGSNNSKNGLKENLAMSKDGSSVHSSEVNESLIPSMFGWALYFNRSLLERNFGRIKVSMGLNLKRGGFFIFAFDTVTLIEVYRFITYEESIHFFYNKSVVELQSQLISNVDDSVLYDLVDDLFSTVEVMEIPGVEDYHQLVLFHEGHIHHICLLIRVEEVKKFADVASTSAFIGDRNRGKRLDDDKEMKARRVPYLHISTECGIIEPPAGAKLIGWSHYFSSDGYESVDVESPPDLENKSKFESNSVSVDNDNKVKAGKTLELPVVYFVEKQSKTIEENKICFKGKIKPVNPLYESAPRVKRKKPSAFSAVRMVLNSKLSKLKVMAEYYVEDAESAVTALHDTELPVRVKEVVSEEPGIVSKIYRIEILTNTGLIFGHTDIIGYNDLRMVVGAEKKDLLNAEQLDFNQIFNYICTERLMLNMIPISRHLRAGGRRPGFRITGSANGKMDGLVVGLKRDNIENLQEIQESLNEVKANDIKMDLKLPRHWIRIKILTHRIGGRSFRSIVKLMSNEKAIFENPNAYFERKDNDVELHKFVNSLHIHILSFDLYAKKDYHLVVLGPELFDWLPVGFDFDTFYNAYRRMRFGEYLLANLALTYSEEFGEFYLRKLVVNSQEPARSSNVNM